MNIAGMICGIIGGILGLLFGMFVAHIGALAAAKGVIADTNFWKVNLAIAIPLAAIVGGAISKVNAALAGALMAVSTAGTAYVIGVNWVTGIPLALTGIGALLAFMSINERKQNTK